MTKSLGFNQVEADGVTYVVSTINRGTSLREVNHWYAETIVWQCDDLGHIKTIKHMSDDFYDSDREHNRILNLLKAGGIEAVIAADVET